MKHILIVEDDSFKLENLRDCVMALILNAEIQCVCDVSSAVDALEQNIYDLIIIDMALPSHPVISGGGSPLSLLTGGLELLFELRYMERDDPCIIVTQYPEIEISGKFFSVPHAAAAIKHHFDCEVLGCIEYSEDSATWKQKLSDLIEANENINT